MNYRMLRIPTTARISDSGGVRPKTPVVKRSEAIANTPVGAPPISEGERMKLLREQRIRNSWRTYCQTHAVAQTEEPDLSGPAPSR